MRVLTCYIALIICFLSVNTAEAFSLWPFGGNPSSDPLNPSNNKLLGMPENGQAAMLSKATGYNCIASDIYYNGTAEAGVNRGVAFWSITCKNTKQELMIMIAPDDIGNTRVESCSLERHTPWECYEKLKQ